MASLILGTTFTSLWLLRSRPDQVHDECMRGDPRPDQVHDECMRGDPPRPQFIKFRPKFQSNKKAQTSRSAPLLPFIETKPDSATGSDRPCC